MKNIKKSAVIVFVVLLISSCQPDKDLVTPDLVMIKNIKDTEALLRDNTWGFNDFTVNVQYEMRAIPLLANVADANGMVQPGKYRSYEIFGNEHRQDNYSYQFTTTDVNRDTSVSDEYVKVGTYNVLNATEIRLNPENAVPVRYYYRYLEEEGVFKMTSDHLANEKINEAVNKIVAGAIYSGKPNDIADAVMERILGNENLQKSIQLVLYDLINGKIDEVTNNPEEIAEKLAELILPKLKEIDWQGLVYGKVYELLGELQVDDPEGRAQELSLQISNALQTSISKDDIYNAIYPILAEFENETLENLVPAMAQACYELFAHVFSEENIYLKIYPMWVSFSMADSTSIEPIADTLGSVITSHFFDEESLAASLVPFMETLRSTSTHQMPGLAQDIIDNILMPLVDNINATFPGMELEPDWATIKPVLTSALTVLKSTIADQTNEEAAATMAANIVGILDSVIADGVASAISMLQDIPADQASQVIAAWAYNLVEMAEPEVVAFLEEKFSELVGMFNAEEIAENLSEIIYNKIMEVFGADTIYDLIYPIVEQISEINIDAAAKVITHWLFELGIIKDNVTEEEVLAALTEIISEQIGNINSDEVSKKLVYLIMQSNIVESIDGNILEYLIELKSYELLLDISNSLNSIDEIELSIIKKF